VSYGGRCARRPCGHQVRSLQDHPRGFLIDAELNSVSIETLRQWAARRVDFVVTDPDTGEDITRILLA
jgi:hypothetical protein